MPVPRACFHSAAALFLGLLAGAVAAETWDTVHTSSNRTDWIDRDSVKMRQGRWSAWTRTRFTEPQRRNQDGTLFRSARSLVYFDCDGRRMGVATIRFYSDADWNATIGSLSAPDLRTLPMDPAPPGSQGADLLDAGCSRR